MSEGFSARSKKIVEWYERRLAPVAFIIGFVFDSITFTRVDFLFDHIILVGHLLIAASGILLVNAYGEGRLRGGFASKFALLYPLAIQFSFGALFSGFAVLFSRSGSFAASWPFLLILGVILVGNEFFRKRYERFIFHISIYFVALFSYAIIAIPVLLRSMGPWIFILSGVASVGAILLVVSLVAFVARATVRENRFRLIRAVGGIYLAFTFFYFTNVIPPVPLVLKHLEMYHSLERLESGKFRLEYERAPWYAFSGGVSRTVHWMPGERVVVFSSVFAPTDISTKITHRWLYYDEEARAWTEKSSITFSLVGGRDAGYRGYSEKEAITPGKWRVEVRTERGQLLGRTTFDVVETTAPPALEVREL